MVTLGLLAGTGALQTYAEGAWVQRSAGRRSHLTAESVLVVAVFVGLLVTTIGGPVVAGMATAYAGAQALGRDGPGR